jgi:hypothetical protein
LHEYAIIIALLAIVSIGALNLLGNNLSNLLGQFSNPNNQNDAKQLYALVDANIGGNGGSKATAARTVQIKVNAQTGQVNIVDTNSGGTNVTSVDGDDVINGASLALAQLANTKMGNGEDMPDDIQAMIRQLASNGTNLGGMYRSLQDGQQDFFAVTKQIEAQAKEGKYGGPPYYDSTFVGLMIQHTDQYIQLSQTYQKLDQRLAELAKTDSSMAKLQDQISGYAGAITGINHNTIGVPTFGQFSIDNVRPTDLMASLSQAPAAMKLFAPVAEQTQTMPPEVRKAIFQKSFVGLGQQMLSGKPINSEEGLSISLPGVPAPTTTATANHP